MNVEMVETVEKPMPDEQARRQVPEMRDVHVVPSAGITLDESQRQALAIIRRSAIAVLTGGPGTGKTTITKQVVSEALADGRRIAAMRTHRHRGQAAGRVDRIPCHHHPQRHGSHSARRRRAGDAAGSSRHAAGR